MVTVALIVTGEMEKGGLAQSLRNAFPNVVFTDPQRVDGFTSTKVIWPPPKVRDIRSAVEKFATALLAAFDPGRRKPSPDYVFGIEDLELVNRQEPRVVIEAVRNAVRAELEIERQKRNARSYEKLCVGVREHCSFRLFAPMPEAYFFADPNALQATGCTRPAILVPGRDVEHFETSDPAYLTAPPQPFPSWAIDPATRPFHPKRYLQFLFEPAKYSETEEGTKGLLALNWRGVLGQPAHTLFLRSLFQDLAHAVGLEASEFSGDTHPLTSDHKNKNRVLRNC